MMNPDFIYQNPSVDASKLAYNLALIYAKAKLEEMFRTEPEYFSCGPATREIEEAVFLEQKFMQAYGYYMGAEPGDFERLLQDFGN